MARTDPRTELVSVPGGHLWTSTTGCGPPVVLCHGGPGLSDNLLPLARLVDHRATVHRFDQRGGPRSTLAGPLAIDALIDDLERLRLHWGHDRWIVGGHSWGANLALFYALRHPARVRAVLYISGVGTTWGWQADTRRHRLSKLRPDERHLLVALERRVAAGDESALAPMLRLFWSTDFATRAAADRVLEAGPLYDFPRNEAAAAQLSESHRRTLDAGIDIELARLPVPLLALHGDVDADPARSRGVAALAPLGRCVSVPAAGHSPWLENPDAVERAIDAVLDTTDDATGVEDEKR